MSPPRKFSGKVHPGRGIDGAKGESFAKSTSRMQEFDQRDAAHPEAKPYNRNDGSRGGDKFIEKGSDKFLHIKQGDDLQFRAGSRDLWDDAETNANPEGMLTGGRPGPITAGVDREDSAGSKNEYSTNSRGKNR